MNTESGRIYLPEEIKERLTAQEARRALDEHQAEFERRLADGKIVPVSDRVAVQQLRGQEAEARRARRKAQKAARKRNRRS